jgi:DNA-3-methyladenine glycosylase
MEAESKRPLAREFYERKPTQVARELLGHWLIRRSREGLCAGWIVETEAYLAEGDSACHSFRGMNRKNATMFGPAGHLYVYPIHSRYCLNAVTESRHVASAVLIRAVEPVVGLELMAARRGNPDLMDLTRGPGRLCEAFGVDRRLDGWDLTRGVRIWIAEGKPISEAGVVVSPRVGVTSAHELELRFLVRDNRFVSKRRTYADPSAGQNASS